MVPSQTHLEYDLLGNQRHIQMQHLFQQGEVMSQGAHECYHRTLLSMDTQPIARDANALKPGWEKEEATALSADKGLRP